MISPAKMVKFFFFGTLVILTSRRRTPVVPLVLILIWTPLVLLRTIIVHSLIAIWSIFTKLRSMTVLLTLTAPKSRCVVIRLDLRIGLLSFLSTRSFGPKDFEIILTSPLETVVDYHLNIALLLQFEGPFEGPLPLREARPLQ